MAKKTEFPRVEAYDQGWEQGYTSAVMFLRGIGAPQLIERLSDTFIGSSGHVMAAMLEENRGLVRDLLSEAYRETLKED